MLQKVKLLTGKLHRLATAQHAVTAQIYFHIPEGIAVLLFRQSLGTTQNGFHTREQFPDRERFGDVIIGAQFEADDFVYLLPASGEHNDGNRGTLGLQLLAYIQAAHAWHHHVQNYQVWRFLQGALEALNTIWRREYFKAFELKVVAEAGDHVWLVLDD